MYISTQTIQNVIPDTRKGRLLKYTFVSLIFATCFFILFIPNHVVVPTSEVQRDFYYHKALSADTGKRNPEKYILFWNTYYGGSGWPNAKALSNCGEGVSCYPVFNQTLAGKVDAVVFFPFMMKNRPLPDPERRNTNQRYVFYSQEPPIRTIARNRFNASEFNGYFNWTMTYKRDSDFVAPYAVAFKRNSTYRADGTLVKSKNKMAVAFVSNCNKDRLAFMKEMNRSIRVDIYGYCGKGRVCVGNDTCLQNLISRYRFILAFENSRCPDYITEKYWSRVDIRHGKLGAVPVVRGPSSDAYRELAIPGSYIHTDDFSSPRSLALYLKKVAKNSTLYLQYFNTRFRYRIFSSPKKFAWCKLCMKLHNKKEPRKVWSDLSSWWEGCLSQN